MPKDINYKSFTKKNKERIYKMMMKIKVLVNIIEKGGSSSQNQCSFLFLFFLSNEEQFLIFFKEEIPLKNYLF